MNSIMSLGHDPSPLTFTKSNETAMLSTVPLPGNSPKLSASPADSPPASASTSKDNACEHVVHVDPLPPQTPQLSLTRQEPLSSVASASKLHAFGSMHPRISFSSHTPSPSASLTH